MKIENVIKKSAKSGKSGAKPVKSGVKPVKSGKSVKSDAKKVDDIESNDEMKKKSKKSFITASNGVQVTRIL